MEQTTLPPGTDGFPILGETLPFVRDMFGFMRERFAKHGPIFRSHVLGTPTLPKQDLSVRGDIVPPEPKDGLRAIVEEAR